MRLSCEQARGALERYFDGELSGSRRQRLGEHLAGCAACRAELDALAALGEAVRRGLARQVESVDFGQVWSAVERGIGQDQKGARLAFGERLGVWLSEVLVAYRKLWIAGAAAAAVVLALVAPAFMRTQPVHQAVSIEEMETAEQDDGGEPASSTAKIIRVPDGKGGTTTVIWVTEPGSPDGGT